MSAAPFRSILWRDDAATHAVEATPDFFGDLGLDKIVADVIGWKYTAYDLAPFFHAPLDDADEIARRQDVLRDLERPGVIGAVSAFAQRMNGVRARLETARKAYYPRERQKWQLAAAADYGRALLDFSRELDAQALASSALCEWRDWLREHTRAPAFERFATQARQIEAALAAIRYGVHIDGTEVTVRPAGDEADYTAAVAETFGKFWRRSSADYRTPFKDDGLGLNRVEAQILDRVALLFPDVFAQLDAFCAEHADFIDATVARFDREVHFYVAWLEHAGKLAQTGLAFCRPALSSDSKETRVVDGFDLALAGKLAREGKRVVCNDAAFGADERILVVSGPNHGGKTTFARMFGQLHYLAKLGLGVPAREAKLFLCDRVFAHFERAENAADLRGKLHADLVRIRAILDAATPRSLVILNEIFASTTLKDAVFLSREVLARVERIDALALCVTFLAELATFNDRTVSTVSRVDADDPARRTFKLERRPADGLAYALAVAEKHGITYARLRQRIAP